MKGRVLVHGSDAQCRASPMGWIRPIDTLPTPIPLHMLDPVPAASTVASLTAVITLGPLLPMVSSPRLVGVGAASHLHPDLARSCTTCGTVPDQPERALNPLCKGEGSVGPLHTRSGTHCGWSETALHTVPTLGPTHATSALDQLEQAPCATHVLIQPEQVP